MDKLEILQQCTVHGNVVKLPNIKLDRKLYDEVANALNGIQGKWKGNKIQGFVFDSDPTELLAEIAGGAKRNIKKEFQFFGTSDKVGDIVVGLAEIGFGHRICEPSAGQGALVKAVHRKLPNAPVDVFELLDSNRKILMEQCSNITLVANDFIVHQSSKKYDRIVANPPFSKNQDIDHFMKMWDMLDDGGILVCIMSAHWELSSNKKEKAFKDFLDSHDAYTEELPAGEFKKSGTMVRSIIVKICK